MSLQIILVGALVLQTLVICGAFIALVDLSKRLFRCDDFTAFCLGVMALGLLGYLCFWIAYLNYFLSTLFRITVLSALLFYAALSIIKKTLNCAFLIEPLLFTCLFFVIVIALGFSNGGIDHPDKTAAIRFSHELPFDNIIPFLFAEALRSGHVPSPLVGATLSSDRPPLPAGLFLLLAIKHSARVYQLVESWLQASFLFGVWGVAFATGVTTRSRRLILLSCCLLPTTILNTFFVWPKMMTVTFLLLLFALLFCRPRPVPSDEKTAGILIGGLTALALLCHGTPIFALFGFGMTVLVFWQWPARKTVTYAALTAFLLYLPWIGYQWFIDPPANLLLKWHLAGVTHVDSRGFFRTLIDSYSTLTWQSYIDGRIKNFWVMVVNFPYNLLGLARLVQTWNPTLAAQIRGAEFFRFLPSLELFAPALLCTVLLVPFFWNSQKKYQAVVSRLVVSLLFTCAIFIILIFAPGQTTNHVGTYANQVMATMAPMFVLTAVAPLLAVLFLAFQALAVATVYGFTLPYDPAFWPMQALCVTATGVLLIYSLVPVFTARGSSQKPES